jgi:hypothetical protein
MQRRLESPTCHCPRSRTTRSCVFSRMHGFEGAARVRGYSHVSSIFFKTPIRVPFSSAAATLSLSPNCLLTCSSVLWVPFLIRTSTRKRGGRACSSRTRTPRPMTVAREQWVIVGVISTTTVLMDESGEDGGRMCMSGKLTTASEPSESGCSGSEMVEMRSVMRLVSEVLLDTAGAWGVNGAGTGEGVRTENLLLVYALDDVVVRVARRKRLLEGVAQVVVAGHKVVEQARAAVVASPRGRIAAAGGQIRGVQDRRVCIVLVVHGCDVSAGVVWRGGKGKVQSLSAPSSRKGTAWHPSLASSYAARGDWTALGHVCLSNRIRRISRHTTRLWGAVPSGPLEHQGQSCKSSTSLPVAEDCTRRHPGMVAILAALHNLVSRPPACWSPTYDGCRAPSVASSCLSLPSPHLQRAARRRGAEMLGRGRCQALLMHDDCATVWKHRSGPVSSTTYTPSCVGGQDAVKLSSCR